MHGGGSPQAKAAVERRRQEAEATALREVLWDPDASAVRDPVEALASLAGKTEHAVDVLGAMVTAGELEGPASVALSRMIRELRQMLEALDRLGLEERRVRLAEQTGAQLAGVVRAVLDRLALSDEQRALALTVVPDEFRRLGAGEVVRGEVE